MKAKQSPMACGIIVAGFVALSANLHGAAAILTTALPANGNVVVSWDSRGALEKANQISGPWTTITNAPNPYTTPITNGARFFRSNQTVDATTLHKKVLCGYQGWFSCPGDGGRHLPCRANESSRPECGAGLDFL